ncbi:MAG: PKD domain-containing protein, partial [Thermoplasmata archaeon]|nr:PKD domain-containing protein [Thermoplasmata archaeon]
GPLAPYSWNFGWGDGTNTSTGLYNKTTFGLSIVNVSHYYAIPAIYWVVISANFSCPWGGAGWGTGGQLNAFGPGGPQPINASTNVSRGLVPLEVAYTASVAAAPANATAEISIWGPAIFGMLQIASPVPSSGNLSFDAQLTAPGYYQAFLQVYYPGSPPVYGPSNSSLYAEAYLPIVNVTPAAVLNVSHTSPVGLSPWNLTWWANVTNLSGGPYAGNGTIEWGFADAAPGWNGSANPWQWATGPAVGSPVNRTYYLNQSGAWPVEATANLVDAAGITEAITSAGLFLGNNTGPPWNGSTLLLNSSVNNGSTPLHFNLTAQLLPAAGTNITNTQLDIAAFNASGAIAWNSTTYNWTGSPITIPGTLTVPGQYYVLAAVFSIVPITNGTWIANANVTLTVLPAVAGPPSLSFSASPSTGGAPLNVTIDLVASGGSAPYSLSVCQEGPFSSPNGTGACASIGSAMGWNGSAVSMSTSFSGTGNYTILATVTDAASQSSKASAGIVVAPPTRLAPLTAHASYVAPDAISTGGATYGFVTGVSGGEAPYSIQWSFGDGAMGSAVPGGTTEHTFVASGTYFASLTVTDARGTQAHSS